MAPNKKYLSLEEASAQLGVKPEELIRMREKGDVRGFADRGTWKFKADDVAECRRRRQPDSDPDLPIMDDQDDEDLGRQATVVRRGRETKSDSDVRMVPSDDFKKSGLTGSSAEVPAIDSRKSDSDVRLVESPKSPKRGSDSDVKLVKPGSAAKSDSDSDVKMFDAPVSPPESDSDVKLLDPLASLRDSDSDVRLTASDSDVRLAPFANSDSDVKLLARKPKGGKSDSDSHISLLPGSSAKDKSGGRGRDVAPLEAGSGDIDFDQGDTDNSASVLLDGDDSAISLPFDSGIQLEGDSGIQLAGDSGIRLGVASGIRLGGDSGIRLADDSGVQLKQPADSGISLEGMDSGVRLADSGINLGEDSGINLASSPGSKKLKGSSSKHLKPGSGKAPKGAGRPLHDDLDATAPMMLSGLSDDDLDNTSPLLLSSDSGEASVADLDMFDASDTSEMQSLDESEQNVVMFDDDEEDAPPVPKRGKQKTIEESIFEVDDAADEELEVSDDQLSGEDEIDDLAFDEGNDDLDESFTTGASQLGFGGPQKLAVAQEVEWSAGFCGLLAASLLVLTAGSWVSADLLRTVWAQGRGYEGIAGMMAGLWK